LSKLYAITGIGYFIEKLQYTKRNSWSEIAAEGRRQKAEGRRQKAEGRRQKAEGNKISGGAR